MADEIAVKGYNYFKSKSAYESEVSAGKVEFGSLNFIEETGEILVFNGTFGGSGSIDTEQFALLSRDFSDDFNNDFAR